MLSTTARRAAAATKSAAATAQRSFFTGVFADHPGQNPLTEEFPGVPATQPSPRVLGDLRVTKLDNGLRVASQETSSPLASVGVYVDAGSRRETRSEAGVSFLLQRLAFKSTQSRSHLRLVRDMEDAGLNLSAVSDRDSIVFSGEGQRNYLPELVDLLGDSVMSPLFADWEVNAWQGKVLQYDSPVIESDANIALSEATHAAAFQDDTPLGHASYISSAALGSVTSNDLRAFVARNFAANNMVVAATGVDHDELVALVGQQFGGAPATAEGTAGAADYVGGSVRFATPSPVAYYSISFNGPALNGDQLDVAAARVVQAALGTTVAGHDGLANRASRLARAEAKDEDIGVAAAFTRFYRDAGIFGVTAAATEANAGKSFNAVVGLLKDAATITGDELTRAKNQARMAYADSIDSAAGLRNDIGQQLLLTGSVADITAAIDAVTAEDVERVVASALASDVSVAAVGGVTNVPRYNTVASQFKA